MMLFNQLLLYECRRSKLVSDNWSKLLLKCFILTSQEVIDVVLISFQRLDAILQVSSCERESTITMSSATLCKAFRQRAILSCSLQVMMTAESNTTIIVLVLHL